MLPIGVDGKESYSFCFNNSHRNDMIIGIIRVMDMKETLVNLNRGKTFVEIENRSS